MYRTDTLRISHKPYAVDCEGRWDGDSYWGHVSPSQQEKHLDVLRPMLERFPEVPAGYDGWWRF